METRDVHRPKILLIGLDSADKGLLLDGCANGSLPTLQKLKENGAWGVAGAPPGFGSGAIWPSFFTGVSPARHARYFYRQVWPGHYEAQRFEAQHFQAQTLWEALSEAGRRVAVLDVPKAGLSNDLNGIQAVDWLVHGPVYKKLTTWPASLADELSSRFGVDPMPQCDLPGGRDARGHEALRDLLVERVKTKEEASSHYWRLEDWDLMITVFAEPHCVGHQCWHVRDRAHPAFDAEAAARVGDPVLDVYAAIDASIGRMIEDVDEDTIVLVVSGTGMGPNYTGNYVLDEMLRRIEQKPITVGLDLFERAKALAKRTLPISVRKRWRRSSRRYEERVAHSDRQQRSCFSVPHNDIAGTIRVNLVGREPHGIVEPADLESFLRELRSDLLDVRNLETGEPIVDDVVFPPNYCSGPHMSKLPDAFVVWKRDAAIERVGSPKIGEIVHPHRGNRTGDHVSDSLFLAAGPGVAAGEVDSISIMDFAPTVAALLGVTLPVTDGEAIPALCSFLPELRRTGND
jgi:predicted AlkP superfamily phosphohydrolase/phosphomutase